MKQKRRAVYTVASRLSDAVTRSQCGVCGVCDDCVAIIVHAQGMEADEYVDERREYRACGACASELRAHGYLRRGYLFLF